jgi:hypothetical protein
MKFFGLGKSTASVVKCKFVDISGGQCRKAVEHTCAGCGLELCDGHAYVDAMAHAKDRATKRYCEDCLYTL